MSTLTDDTQLVRLTDEWVKAPMARCVPGAYWGGPDDRAWNVIDPTPRAAAVILSVFPSLILEYPWLQAKRDELLRDVRPFDNATPFASPIAAPGVRRALDQTPCAGPDNAGCLRNADCLCRGDGLAHHTMFPFQELDLGYGAAVLETHGAFYIGWERGLGKTMGTCALIEELGLTKCLVVAPNTSKLPVWDDELRRFLPNHEIITMRNTKEQRTRDLGWAKRCIKDNVPTVLVVHYEALAIIEQAKKSAVTWRQLGDWDIVVADEIHRIGNPKTGFTKALKRIKTQRKLGLSGSIIQNRVEELYSPLNWFFPDRYHAKWRDWNDRFLDYVEGYGKICVGVLPEKVEDLRNELGVFMVYRRKEDELPGLPSKTEQTLLVELSAGQRKAYDELVATCVTRLEDDTVIAAEEGLPMLGRLRQVATGLDSFDTKVVDSTKADLAIDMIMDNDDEAFVVFTWYKANGLALQERLEAKGVGTFLVNGDVSQKKRNEYIKAFQAGEGRVFIGTLSTLGESVNLFRANNAIFLDRSWNPSPNTQAADRIYRIGQTKPVTITHIVAKDTVDEFRVLPAIANKLSLRRVILGGI